MARVEKLTLVGHACGAAGNVSTKCEDLAHIFFQRCLEAKAA